MRRSALLLMRLLQSPGKRLPNESTSDFNNRVLAVLLKMLGISHTAQTKVGSAYVRGISGGERKRVSIAEMVGSSLGSRSSAPDLRTDDYSSERLLLGQHDSWTRRQHCSRLRQVASHSRRCLRYHAVCDAVPGTSRRFDCWFRELRILRRLASVSMICLTRSSLSTKDGKSTSARQRKLASTWCVRCP